MVNQPAGTSPDNNHSQKGDNIVGSTKQSGPQRTMAPFSMTHALSLIRKGQEEEKRKKEEEEKRRIELNKEREREKRRRRRQKQKQKAAEKRAEAEKPKLLPRVLLVKKKATAEE